MILVIVKTIRRSNLKKDCFFALNLFFIFSFSSCGYFKTNKHKEQPLAKVGDAYLYPSDLKHTPFTKQDSDQVLKKYIDNWIHETLLLQQAEKNLKDQDENFDKMIADYRKSLITYEYERELIRQKLDTAVTDEEIQKYYDENKSNFELKDNIIKVNYIKVRKDAPKVEKVDKWCRSRDTTYMDSIANYCHQYADNFYLDDNNWLLFDDVLKEIPIKMYDEEAFLQNNRFIETQDSTHLYYVNIKGFMIKNSLSPLSFEKENIKSILINKRKVDMIKSMRDDLYNQAIKNKLFEVY